MKAAELLVRCLENEQVEIIFGIHRYPPEIRPNP